jgi:hypothetical protein
MTVPQSKPVYVPLKDLLEAQRDIMTVADISEGLGSSQFHVEENKAGLHVRYR